MFKFFPRVTRKSTPPAMTSWVAAGAFVFGLAAFVRSGVNARLWADDYCYSLVMAQSGLFGGLRDWFLYSGNRFSTPALVAFTDLFGPAAARFLPAALIVLWVGGWYAFLTQAARALGLNASRRWAGVAALALTFFHLLLAPDRLQTLYWRMGLLHYSLPLAAGLLLAAGILAQLRAPSLRWDGPAAVGVALAAFVLGGFSETAAALQTGLFALALAGSALFLSAPTRRRAVLLTGAGLAGSLAAMGLMLLSPSNAFRQASLPPPDSLGQLVVYTLRYSLDFMRDFVRGHPLPLAVFVLALVALAGLAATGGSPLSRGAALRGTLLALLTAVVGVICAVAPSTYAGLQYPSGRALMPAAFIFLAGLGGAVFFLTAPVAARMPRLAPLALALLLAAAVYPVYQMAPLGREAQALAANAQRWDARDAQIRAQAAAGQREVSVREVEVVRTLEDFGPDPAFWVNRCGAGYYGVSTLTALP